jgi:hypothetical protein
MILYMNMAGTRYGSQEQAGAWRKTSSPLATCRLQAIGKKVEYTRYVCRRETGYGSVWEGKNILLYSSQCMIYACYTQIAGMNVTSCVFSSLHNSRDSRTSTGYRYVFAFGIKECGIHSQRSHLPLLNE